jgi:hypothetical protein
VLAVMCVGVCELTDVRAADIHTCCAEAWCACVLLLLLLRR